MGASLRALGAYASTSPDAGLVFAGPMNCPILYLGY